MEYLGYAIGSFVFLTVVVLFFLYLLSALFDKTEFADQILPLLFLHCLFSVLILFWSLVIMNGGFDIAYGLYMDYTVLLILFVPMFLLVEYADFHIRRKDKRVGSKAVYRFLLPTLTLGLFFLATILFFFNSHYLIYLISW